MTSIKVQFAINAKLKKAERRHSGASLSSVVKNKHLTALTLKAVLSNVNGEESTENGMCGEIVRVGGEGITLVKNSS